MFIENIEIPKAAGAIVRKAQEKIEEKNMVGVVCEWVWVWKSNN